MITSGRRVGAKTRLTSFAKASTRNIYRKRNPSVLRYTRSGHFLRKEKTLVARKMPARKLEGP